MRFIASIFFAATAFLAACNSGGTPGTSDTSDTSAQQQADKTRQMAQAGAACYQKVVGKDTFYLQLIVEDEKVNGVLDYNFFEKDKNTGLIDGSINDNILRATYHFQSEGQKSDRPVVFKVMGEQAYEALADSFDANGVPVFNSDNSLLKFEPQPYKKVDCK
ncbi:hypothetical protein [Chitinophaga sp. YIM B06452]|uniref:hypothetical protein n=1 Tax=Chitinophaga sp. YIM B06452 TaxID=3082158 RepID=UPI0031FEAC53